MSLFQNKRVEAFALYFTEALDMPSAVSGICINQMKDQNL